MNSRGFSIFVSLLIIVKDVIDEENKREGLDLYESQNQPPGQCCHCSLINFKIRYNFSPNKV